jgi:hypothetical protein
MPTYMFAFGTLVDSAQAIEELQDDEAARAHADIVAEELNRNRDQPLALLVRNEQGQMIHRVPPWNGRA